MTCFEPGGDSRIKNTGLFVGIFERDPVYWTYLEIFSTPNGYRFENKILNTLLRLNTF